MATALQTCHQRTALQHRTQQAPSTSRPRRCCRNSRSATSVHVVCAATIDEDQPKTKTILVKTGQEDMPFPWSEKDPYKLPVSIDRVQKLLITLGWEKPWVEQIIDRVMKGMLKTTEERTQGVVDYLTGLGLKQDEVCNMASISVVLLGLNPETRLRPVVEYLHRRGVPEGAVADLILKHPRIFEYRLVDDSGSLAKGRARIQVDVVPLPTGEKACGVNYFREGASFLESPVSPYGPMTEVVAPQ